MKKTLTYVGTIFASLAFAIPMTASASVVYNAIPSPLAPNYPSQPFQAQQTNEFGDYVHLGGTDRQLTTVTVTMSDWALASAPANLAFCESSTSNCDSAGFDWPITVNIYANSLTNDVPNTLLGTKTVVTHISWRPEADTTCSTPTAWRAADNNCYNGYAFNASFDLSDLNLTLPNDVIVGFVYNTQTYGPNPTGVDGPYNSLNIAVPASNPVLAGTDDSANEVFWNTETSTYYTNINCPGNTFCKDTNWSPNGTVAMQINAVAPVVASCPSGTTQSSVIETVTVPANSSTDTLSSSILASGTNYILKAYGTADAGDGITFDARYSFRAASSVVWTDAVSTYESYGTQLLDLLFNTSTPWGSYNSSHEYLALVAGNGALGHFLISDVYNPNNSGEIKVDIYSCEPIVTPPTPTDKDQCKKGGWETFTNPSFKNQGQCVSYVQANEHAGKK